MTLLAAACSVDVTPDVGGPLAGYGDRGPSTGVLDPIEAQLLLLAEDDCRALLVALDAVGVAVSVADRLRAACATRLEIPSEAVLVSCTHTHAGPEWFDMDAAQAGDADRMIALIADGLGRLVDQLTPVHVELAQTDVDVAVNRRQPGPDGVAVMGVDPNGPVDRRATSLVLRGKDRILATVTVAALHGNCLKGDNTCLSSDFVGAFRCAVREATLAPAIFIQGCAGDLNPKWRGDAADAARTGQTLAKAVVASFEEGQEIRGRLAVMSRPLSLAMRSVPTVDVAETTAAVAGSQWGSDVSRWRDWQITHEGEVIELPATMTVLAIGDVFVGGVPWELFCEIGLEASRRFGERALLVGYVNGYYGYLATDAENRRGGYEIDWMPIVYGVNTGMGMAMADGSDESVLRAFGGIVSALT